MTELVSIADARKKKATKCDFCGQPDHEAPFLCPRVCAVSYEGDCVTVELWPLIETEPPAAA